MKCCMARPLTEEIGNWEAFIAHISHVNIPNPSTLFIMWFPHSVYVVLNIFNSYLSSSWNEMLPRNSGADCLPPYWQMQWLSKGNKSFFFFSSLIKCLQLFEPWEATNTFPTMTKTEQDLFLLTLISILSFFSWFKLLQQKLLI